MITIIVEKKILILTENNINNSIKNYIKTNKNIDILKIKDDKNSIKEINKSFHEEYDFIFFTKKCMYSKELINFVPIYFINGLKNKLFINELLVNPIIIENIEKIIDHNRITELGLMLKYILQNEIKQEEFDFQQEIEKIKVIYKCDDIIINKFKNAIYTAIVEHYSQGNIIRKINYRFNRDKIVKIALFKLIDAIIYNLKNTNELVFKKFISITI